jgi:hypothetical protein
MSKSRPSKQDVTNALREVLTHDRWEYIEWPPDVLGYVHGRVTIDGIISHGEARGLYEMRKKMLAWAGSFRSKTHAKSSTSVRRRRIKALAKIERAIAKGGGRDV